MFSQHYYHILKAEIGTQLYSEPVFPQPIEAEQSGYEDWAIILRFYVALHWVSAYLKSCLEIKRLGSHHEVTDLLIKHGDAIGLDQEFVESYAALLQRSWESRYENPRNYALTSHRRESRLEEADRYLSYIVKNPKLKAFIKTQSKSYGKQKVGRQRP